VGRFDREDVGGEELPASVDTATEELRATVEREVREIVEAAEARAAEIERHSERKADSLLQTSIERSEAMRDAIDALEREIGAVIALLREEAESLAAELEAARPTLTAPAAEEDGEETEEDAEEEAEDLEDAEEVPAATSYWSANGDEAREMIRGQLEGLFEAGTPRTEAERILRQVQRGKRYLDLLDEVYAPPNDKPRRWRRRGAQA
jgi:hypothetical protein